MASQTVSEKAAEKPEKPATASANTETRKKERRHFLPSGLDSGDVVLFNRQCTRMSPFGACVCIAAKIWTLSKWDHVGLVVKNEDGSLYMVDAGFTGVQLRPLQERIDRSSSTDIAIRRLGVWRTKEMRKKFADFVQEVANAPYKQDTKQFLRIIRTPDKEERGKLVALKMFKQSHMESLRAQLKDTTSPLQKRELMAEIDGLRTDLDLLQTRLDEEASRKKLGSRISGLVDSTLDANEGLFCSELAAAAYQRSGLLPPFPSITSYSPVTFSSDHLLPLLRNGYLGEEEYLRRKGRVVVPKKSDETFKPPEDLMNQAFGRSYLVSLLSDPAKKEKFISLFKRVEAGDGQVLFSQGDEENCLYFVQEGTLERLIATEGGDPVIVSTLGPGSMCGYNAFTQNRARVSTVRCHSKKCVLWCLDRDAFVKAFADPQKLVFPKSRSERRMLRENLKQNFLFRKLTKVTSQTLDMFHSAHLKRGEMFFKAGEPSDNMYIIKTGDVEVYNEGTLVHTLHSGQSFGSLGLIMDRPRASTAIAKTDVEVWVLPSATFHQLSLTGGAHHLLRTYQRFSSQRSTDKEPRMTSDDFLRFAEAQNIPADDRPRLTALLLAWVSSNRIRRTLAGGSTSDNNGGAKKEATIPLADFVRFDGSLNSPDPQTELLFQVMDQSRLGHVTIENALAFYRDFYPSQLQDGGLPAAVKACFGSRSDKILDFIDFQKRLCPLLPELARSDAKRIVAHFFQQEQSAGAVAAAGAAAAGASELAAAAHASEGAAAAAAKSGAYHAKQTQDVPKAKFLDTKELFLMQVAAMVSQTVAAPLERLQILRQCAPIRPLDKSAKASGSRLSRMVRPFREGVTWFIRRARPGNVHRLFRGNSANLARILPAATIQLAIMNSLIAQFPPGLYSEIICGIIGGITASYLTYPLDVLRARLAVVRGANRAPSLATAFSQVWRNGGIRALYAGAFPSMLGVFPYVGVNFGMYHYYALQKQVIESHPNLVKRNRYHVFDVFWWGTLGNALHLLLAFPLDTCRRRMQVNGSGQTLRQTVREIYSAQGVRGFYRGFLSCQMKIGPAVCTGVLTFETMRWAASMFPSGKPM